MATLGANLCRPRSKKTKKQPKENVEWLWQYSPPPAEGRENQLVLDPRFRPFLAQYLTAPQTFWGNPKTGYKSLAETALDFLSVPDKVLADDNRYLTITGCVFRFCPVARPALGRPRRPASARRLRRHRLDQRQQNPRPARRRIHLWVFANHPIDPDHIPAALIHSIARWTAQPPSGSTVIQQITNAILVDPDGTPHQIPPATIGANTFTMPQTEQKAQP